MPCNEGHQSNDSKFIGTVKANHKHIQWSSLSNNVCLCQSGTGLRRTRKGLTEGKHWQEK